jgi:hypothetical protein
LWLSKFIFVFLCPDRGRVSAGEAAVKAERSEFILSLDGGRSQLNERFGLLSLAEGLLVANQ